MKTYILRAEDELACAKELFQYDFYRGALNHCYYACIWLMRGLLAEQGIFTKIIDGAITFFETYLVPSAQIPQTMQQSIAALIEAYQIIQKDITGDFVPEEILTFIEKTEDFLLFVKIKEQQLARSN